ncbi:MULTISPECIES: hypothetical protein [unclassified Caballeronia]|jgi:hypothetical protein|uniref:hypothetical protein n=1 Tax=unclassified Caballeronia TaxID=2646786 RepID=UPI002862F680|nr:MULTISPECIES: hypothetical protein [unclassified Caballeronia]MDR5755223.1 hypothetical protein [Caballeronia sp. LZ024]MDR5845408.1 hypothetical protein [Caballeronia sp. LZ031]
MLKPPVDVFVTGKALVDLKEIVVNACIENARSEGSSLTVAERKGATFFYKYAEMNLRVSKARAAQYVRVYERFVDSRHRAKVEALFNAGELAVLAPYSDDELTEIVLEKAMNPTLTREQLKHLLKTRQAA